MTTIAVARRHGRDVLATPAMPVVCLALLYIVLVPSNSWMPAPAYDEQRTLQAWLWVAAGATLLLDARVRRAALELGRRNRAAVTVGSAIFAYGLASTAVANDRVGGILELGLFAGVLTLAACVAVGFSARPRLASAALVVAAIIALLYYAGDLLTLPGLTGRGLWLRGRAGGFDNVRFMNHFHGALLPIAAVGATARRQKWWVRALPLLAAATAAFYLFHTEGRAATLGLVLAVTAVALGRRGRVTSWARAIWLAALLGLGATFAGRLYTFVTGRRTSMVDPDVLAGDSGRLDMWREAIDVMRESPIFGLGPGGFAYFPNEPLLGRSANPHNSVLQFGGEWGIPVAVAISCVLAISAWLLVLRPAAPAGDLGEESGITWVVVEAALSASLLQMLLESGLAGVFVTPVSQVLLGTVLGAVVGMRAYTAGTGPIEPPAGSGVSFSTRRLTVVGLLLLGLLTLVPLGGVLGRDVADVDRQTCLSSELFGGVVAPRFWLQGFRGMPTDDC